VSLVRVDSTVSSESSSVGFLGEREEASQGDNMSGISQ
jgi:hypothetical protein